MMLVLMNNIYYCLSIFPKPSKAACPRGKAVAQGQIIV